DRGVVDHAQHVLVPVRLHDLDRLATTGPLLASDRHGQVVLHAGELRQPLAQPFPFRTAGSVVAYRFVARFWYGEDGVHHGLLPLDGAGEIEPFPYPPTPPRGQPARRGAGGARRVPR